MLFHTALNLSSEAPPGEIREFQISFEQDLKSLISELLLCRQGERGEHSGFTGTHISVDNGNDAALIQKASVLALVMLEL